LVKQFHDLVPSLGVHAPNGARSQNATRQDNRIAEALKVSLVKLSLFTASGRVFPLADRRENTVFRIFLQPRLLSQGFANGTAVPSQEGVIA